jgi:hypothetical protein
MSPNNVYKEMSTMQILSQPGRVCSFHRFVAQELPLSQRLLRYDILDVVAFGEVH